MTAREVAMIDLDFSPRAVSAAAGDTITWVNRGSAIHTATAEGAAFDSGIVAPGGRFTFSAATPGIFAYHCAIHPSMRGTVTVVARDGPSPAVVAPAVTAAVPSSSPGGAPAPSTPGTAAAADPVSASVSILDFEFSPARVRVAAGGEVTWTNEGAAPHSATARDRSSNSGILSPQGIFSRRFDTPGAYEYVCLVHPGMVGVVEVGTVVAGAVLDAPGLPVVPAGTDSPGGGAGTPGATESALPATGVAAVGGDAGQFLWVPVLLAVLIFGALAWAGFGPSPVDADGRV
jgi:plastocyanin